MNINDSNGTRRVEYFYEKRRDSDERFFAVHYHSQGLLPQFHSCMEVFSVVKGEVDAVVNNRHYKMTDGSVLLINSFEIHSYTTVGEAEVACILLGNECIADFMNDYRDYEFITEFTDKARSEEIIKMLVYINERQLEFDLFEQKGFANLVFSRIIKGGGIRPKSWANNVKIANIIKYIYENSEKDISLKNIADAFNYAPMSVSHMFSHYVGMDLRCFVNEVRIQKAFRMIHDDGCKHMSVIEIAGECGFNSAATFYRSYRRRYGETPRR